MLCIARPTHSLKLDAEAVLHVGVAELVGLGPALVKAKSIVHNTPAFCGLAALEYMGQVEFSSAESNRHTQSVNYCHLSHTYSIHYRSQKIN